MIKSQKMCNEIKFSFIFLVFGIMVSISCNNESTIISPVGGHQLINMKDGTEIMLGPESMAKYNDSPFGSPGSIHLEGEAEIKVKPGNQITIRTPNGIVNAQGSSFRVHSRRSDMNVHCMTGKVEVSNIDGGTPKVLVGGEYAIYRGKNLAVSGPKRIDQMTNDKYWVFSSASLSFVLESITAQYGVSFNGDDANLNKVFSGFVPRDELEIALSIALRSSNIDYNSNGSVYTLTERTN